jgi:hypothetical protein
MVPYLVVKNPVGRRTLHGNIDFRGLPLSIENNKSSSRQWYNPDNGTTGITRMEHPYGYVTGTLAVDGDAVDIFLGPDRDSDMVFIIHQRKAPDFKDYDEDKCMLAFSSEEKARAAYLKHYTDPRFLGPITTMPFEEFKEKVFSMRGKMIKSHVHGHTRQSSSGKVSFVHDYNDRRHPADEPIPAPNGRDSFGYIQGEIAARTGLVPGPIKLLRGKQFSEHKGFGKEHIAKQHGEEIRAAGYETEEDFVADVIRNYNAIYKVGENRYALVADGNNQQKIHIIEIRKDAGQSFYTVVTGYIANRQKFTERNYQLLWKRGGLRKSAEEYCKKIGDELGVDWNEVDLDEFCDGMFVEEEHKDLTGGDPKKTAKIVLAHLREVPDYYSKLEKVEKSRTFVPFLLKSREDKCTWLI